MLADGYKDVVTDHVRTVTGTEPGPLTRFGEDFSGVMTEQAGSLIVPVRRHRHACEERPREP